MSSLLMARTSAHKRPLFLWQTLLKQ